MGGSQLLAHSRSSTHGARSELRRGKCPRGHSKPQLRDALNERIALPNGFCEFTLQLTNLAQSWPCSVNYGTSPLRTCRHGSPTSSCTPHWFEEGPRTLQDLVDALEEQMRGAPRAAPAILEGQVVHQEVLLLQQVGFELAILAPSEWVAIWCLRCALTGNGPRSHLANHLAGVHIDSFTSRPASKASSVGISVNASQLPSWFGSMMFTLRRVSSDWLALPALQSVSCSPVSASHAASYVRHFLCFAAVCSNSISCFWQLLILQCKDENLCASPPTVTQRTIWLFHQAKKR